MLLAADAMMLRLFSLPLIAAPAAMIRRHAAYSADMPILRAPRYAAYRQLCHDERRRSRPTLLRYSCCSLRHHR